eukprot:TRINITY_DN12767_c0_g1_i10.p1 TRINITY_DN12767_c0_g1~~TRINITY_DN12767_c0_g1_i10.p1  ORF type:complete len:129 (-),score=5.29 TRINITY_DN12767_c0_g1_i10:529-915(-)
MLVGQSDFFYLFYEILVSRWNKSLKPLHCAAHTLNPKYYSYAWLTGVGRGVKCVAPNMDVEVSCNRVTCFDCLFPSEKVREVNVEFGKFCTPSGYFSNLYVMEDRNTSDPCVWWGMHGFSAPMLSELA